MSQPGSNDVMWQRRATLKGLPLSWKPFAGMDFEDAPSFDYSRQSLCEASFVHGKKGSSVYIFT